MKEVVTISGVWLRAEGNNAVVLVERDGVMVEIIREAMDGPFSHIAEAGYIARRLRPGMEKTAMRENAP